MMFLAINNSLFFFITELDFRGLNSNERKLQFYWQCDGKAIIASEI